MREGVVEAGVALRQRLELIVEVHEDLRQRDLVLQQHAARADQRRLLLLARALQVIHALELTTAAGDQLHHHADVAIRADDGDVHPGLADDLDVVGRRQVGRVVDDDLLAVGSPHFVLDARRSDEQIEVVLALEALLHNLHMQQAEEAAAEAGAEGNARLRLKGERRVVELELLERFAEERVVVGLRWVEAGEDHRLRLAIAGERLRRRRCRVSECVADADVADVFEAGRDVADFACAQATARLGIGDEEADLERVDIAFRQHEAELVPVLDGTIDHSEVGEHAFVGIVLRIEDESAQGRRGVAARRWHQPHDGLEQVAGAGAFLSGGEQDFVAAEADDVADLLGDALRVGAGEVDLVDHGNDRKIVLHRDVDVGDRLRLDALRGVDDEDGALAGGKRARYLVGEVDVAGRIDQVELVLLAVAGVVRQANGLGLDRHALLALEVHRVEHLLDALTAGRGDEAGDFEEAVGEGGFAVVDVGDDAKITDVVAFHQAANSRGQSSA